MEIISPHSGTNYFKYAREESLKSDFRCKVGACLVIGKSIVKGHNKRKTHPRFANPSIHIKTSIHAELDCLARTKKIEIPFATLYVYRETQDGNPAMSKPCVHCMSFLRDSGIKTIYYSVQNYPYYKKENL